MSDKKYIRKYIDSKGKTRYVYPKEDKRTYLKDLAKVAPIFLAKSVIGDIPIGATEQVVTQKLKNPKTDITREFKKALKGRGLGRGLGAASGVLTAPVFLKGIELAGSKNKDEAKAGLALIGLSSAAFQLPKGSIEKYLESRSTGHSKPVALKKGLLTGLARSVYKTPAALIMGLGVAAGRKPSQDKKDAGLAKKVIVPAATSALFGATSRGFEEVLDSVVIGKNKNIVKAVKKALPAMGGGAVGGLLAGAALSTAVEGASKLLKKEAGIIKAVTGVNPPLPLKLTEAVGEASLLHAGIGGALNYGAPGRAFSKFRIGRKAQRFTRERQANALAVGLKEGIAGRVGVGLRASFFGNLTMPELLVPRMLGQDIGRALRKLPPRDRELALRGVKQYVKIRPHLKFNPRTGEPTPVLNYVEDAVDKALGDKRMFGERGKLKTLAMKAYYGRRGISQKGLPKAGKLDKDNIAKKLVAPAAIGTAGFASLVANPIPIVSPHLFVAGLKGSLPYAPITGKALAGEGKKEFKKGALRGLFPKLKTTKGDKAFSVVKRYVVTPAIDDLARVAESVTSEAKRLAVDSVKPGVNLLTRNAIKAKRSKLNKQVARTTTQLAGAGALSGIAASAINKLQGDR